MLVVSACSSVRTPSFTERIFTLSFGLGLLGQIKRGKTWAGMSV
jgi:hypothetical protein